jgi:hypothetical protein
MERGENVNRQLVYQSEENPYPLHPPNINTQIDEGFATLRTLVNQLRGTREPIRESLATSLDVIVRSIPSSQGKLTSISEYRERMFEYYNTGLDRNQVIDLGIYKKQLMSIFIDPRSRKNHL